MINLRPPTWSLKIIPLPQLEFCKKTLYIDFKCSLGDCISKNNNIYCRFNLNYPIEKTYNAPF